MPARHGTLGWLGALAAATAFPYAAIGLSGRVSAWLEGHYLEAFVPQREWEYLPPYLEEILWGPYGVLTMVPLLLVWTLPLMVSFTFLLEIYRSSHLLSWVAYHLDPWVHRFGLRGQDLTTLVAGLGCKVPLATRGRRSCSPSGCHLLYFAVPCSYQLAASLSLLNRQGMPWLLGVYIAYLGFAGLVYAWWFWGRKGIPIPQAVTPQPLQMPDWGEAWRRTLGSFREFLEVSVPLFLAVALLASTLKATGLLSSLAVGLGPLWKGLGLPPEAGLALLASTLRKDGVLLLAPLTLGPGPLLLALYLSGSLVPCAVTLRALSKREGGGFLLVLLKRQTLFTLVSALPLVGLAHIWR
ncbi:MAG: nucleoside recognition domain-containing protein [Thermus sp.]|uniref:nucleoside recognition domain-containing protein n=1 Tax=Thermus sp. TaxID=275 RepID=UPI00391ACC46